MSATLISCRGAKPATLADLKAMPTPARIGARHRPIRHDVVLETARDVMAQLQLPVLKERVTLANRGQRMFATFDLACPAPADGLPSGVAQMSVGLRNSHDQKFALGVVGGSRVLVCDNLSFVGSVKETRMHTSGVVLPSVLHEAIRHAQDDAAAYSVALAGLLRKEVSPAMAAWLFTLCLRNKALTGNQLAEVVDLWYTAQADRAHKYHGETAWNAYNCVTDVYKAHGDPETTVRRSAALNRVAGRLFDIPALAA